MSPTNNPDEISIGVIGLGLMGSSIIAALLMAGHPVKAIAPLRSDLAEAPRRIREHLRHSAESGLLTGPVRAYEARLTLSEDYALLKDCRLVQECVIEVPEIKAGIYRKVAAIVDRHAVIASNTSAIPISHLQKQVPHPERFMGIHWAEPAYMTRFLEVTRGQLTAPQYADWVCTLAGGWGKEPTLLRKDIRGFITNRLMYAVYREALALMQRGEATLEDVDKAFRYDAGSWMTLMGIFRRMDFLGLPDQWEILRNVFPKLSNEEGVPPLMQEMIDNNARGIHNLKGLFPYSEEEARQWEEAFALFNQDIFKLAARYPSEPDSMKSKTPL